MDNESSKLLTVASGCLGRVLSVVVVVVATRRTRTTTNDDDDDDANDSDGEKMATNEVRSLLMVAGRE